MLETYNLEQVIEPLLTWYQQNKRSLPWRDQVSPYRTWVSEIMLQQTRVEAVKPYFARFMEALPEITDLAACPEEKLLKLWEGLGYYNRVRNMQIAAQTMVEQYGGQMPEEYEQILALKGIGSYTAGAIVSIAFGQPVPAVDGNVLRILMRLTEDPSDIAKQSTKKKAEQVLSQIMPEDQAGEFNQALMELGALVCVPNGEPHCDACPWEPFCLACKHQTYTTLPVKTKAKARRVEQRTILLVRDGEHVVLEKRPAKGLLAGMYQFPNLEGTLTEDEALGYVKDHSLHPMRIQRLESAVHIFSHVEWHMTGYMIQVDSLTREESNVPFVDVETARTEYAIPSAFAAYSEYLKLNLGDWKRK